MLIKTFLADGSLVKVGDTEFEGEGRYNVLLPVDAKRSAIADFAAG
ncbi:hypothetical protein HJA95_05865 [Rhizobium binae]|nr:hypothetical protein [Rhizobium binae]MBX4949122.1 hypothetical protein [Rhizobium binae]MBX4963313.1 hypothetical protein [Rhizobium binae]